MKETRLYRGAGAAILLLLLLCTTAVQISHSHTLKQPAPVQLKKQTLQPYQQQITVPGTDTKCFVYEYQLTKDADFSCFTFQAALSLINEVNNTTYISALTAAPCFYFENRGPPAGRTTA